MIFSLDEELHALKLADSFVGIDEEKHQNPTALYDDSDEGFEKPNEYYNSMKMHHLSVNAEPIPLSNGIRVRRRSSVLEKFPVNTPPHTRRVSITSASISIPDVEKEYEEINDGSTCKAKLSRNLRDFKPIRVLGKGAYGKVILVKDQQTSKLYAMKQLQKAEIIITKPSEDESSGDQKAVGGEEDVSKRIQRTFAEKTILSQLEHPNIVKLFYTFHDNSKLYLLLQYIPGGELFFHLKEHGTLDEDTVAFYAAEISCALKFLHDKGIVYRDLKPENCLLDQNGHLVLTDFGLSKESVRHPTPSVSSSSDESSEGEEVSELHSIIGTPEYCAPEILQGLPYTKNCDWYSLGCLIYDMLVGKPPYTGANHKVILHKIQREKQGPKLPFYLSEGMKDVLGALLKREHTKRWDVDKYWETRVEKNKQKKRKRKAGQERTSSYTSHFIFRKIKWKQLETGETQHSVLGPIVPLITDWALAENFDSEFTSMSYEDPVDGNDTINIPKSTDLFKGFSYKASGSYLERYF